MKPALCFAQPFGYQKASQRNVSGSQDKKVYIVFVGLYMLSFLKGGR